MPSSRAQSMASSCADNEAQPERLIELHHGDRRAVGAESVKHRIAERHIASEAADDVPGLRHGRDEKSADAELDDDVIAEPRDCS